MIIPALELLISIITIIQMYMLSRHMMYGLYVGLASQVLWIMFIVTTKSWGLLPLNVVLWWVFISGIIEWKQEVKDGFM